MDKQQAITAMHDGYKVAHSGFTSDEWMRKIGHLYEFEDGCLCEPREFWRHRTDSIWLEGWKIFVDKPKLI